VAVFSGTEDSTGVGVKARSGLEQAERLSSRINKRIRIRVVFMAVLV
jgi:hypothetical protein